MAKPATAAQLRTAIENLESKLPTLAAAIGAAETAVADAYASGESPDQALDQLSRARGAHAGALKALVDLDGRWYAQADQEHRDGVARVDEKIRALQTRFEVELDGFLEKAVAIVGELFAPSIRAKALEAAEEVLADKRIELSRDCPPSPNKPAPRNDHGRPMTIDEQNRAWRPSDGRTWTGPVHVEPAPKTRPAFDWTAKN